LSNETASAPLGMERCRHSVHRGRTALHVFMRGPHLAESGRHRAVHLCGYGYLCQMSLAAKATGELRRYEAQFVGFLRRSSEASHSTQSPPGARLRQGGGGLMTPSTQHQPCGVCEALHSRSTDDAFFVPTMGHTKYVNRCVRSNVRRV
jgi:hypothetical protein